ncbi:MAG TPA: hypothetical protein VFB04_13290 [Terriglobales bacterium]|nr:hypothetical protein [Terriglobales bacterium]
MARRKSATLLILVLALSIASAAKLRNLPTPEACERARVVDYTHSLEDHPLAKDNLQKRMWLTEWIVNTSAITLPPCCQELSSLDQVNNTYSQQLRMQAVYSQAAFQLEHPNVKDPAAIEAAGLAGTLRAYRAIQRFDPSAKYPLLDDLMSLERKGKLQKYVERRNRCIED